MKTARDNMDIIKERFPALYNKITSSGLDETIEVVETKQGYVVPAVNRGGKRLFVHSRFDPVKEAERFIKEIDTGSFDLFVVFGFGFAYHIEELMKRMGGDSAVLIIEKDPFMLRRALECRDLSRILSDRRVVILLDPDEESISPAVKGKSSRRASLVLHRGSYQTEPDYYGNMQGIVRSFLSTKQVNIATLAKFEKIWASNIARNIGIVTGSSAVNIFFEQFRGVPAIIAAAGPSLNNSIEFIREKQNQALIVAVDTSYKILLRHGIEPHFCIVVDPQLINARYFEGTGDTKTVLIADPMVHPSVFRFFRGRVAITGVAFELLKWIEAYTGEKGEITHGGSVSTNAYDFTRRTGAGPIFLMGQDLAFTGGLAHARGSYLDEQVHLRTTRLFRPEMFNRFQLTALPQIIIKGIRSETVRTNQKLMIFLSWFEKRKDNDLINATFDGAKIPGIRNVTNSDIRFPDTEIDISGHIDGLFNSAANAVPAKEIKIQLAGEIETILIEISTLLPALERAVGISDTLCSFVRSKDRDKNKLDFLLNKLSQTDRIVESKKHAKDMISFTSQRVVHTIGEGHEIDESDSELNRDDLVAKRSLYLYQGLLEGARFNRKILKKMLALL